MTILEHRPTPDEILAFVDDGIRQLQADDEAPHYIVVGPAAYEALRKAIGRRFQRGAGHFETYQHIPIVLDPFRKDEVCVLPGPGACAAGVHPYRLYEDA